MSQTRGTEIDHQLAYRGVAYRLADDLARTEMVVNQTGVYSGLEVRMLEYLIESVDPFVREVGS